MAGKVQIAKLALQHIGDHFDIASLEEESVQAEQIDLIYDDIRKYVLRMIPWRFATKFVKPASLDVTVPANWNYAFQYPTDAVRILWLENPLGRDLAPLEYETAILPDNTRVLLTDEEKPEIRYIADIKDTERFDPEFTWAFSKMIASEIAMSITGDANIKETLRQDAVRQISSAATTSANEGRTKRAPEASWIQARDQD